MSKKRVAVSVILAVLAVGINILLLNQKEMADQYSVTLNITMNSNKENGIQIYYLQDTDKFSNGFYQAKSQIVNYEKYNTEQCLSYILPGDVKYLRLDIGEGNTKTQISNMEILCKDKKIEIALDELIDVVEKNHIDLELCSEGVTLYSDSKDPYLVWNTESWGIEKVILESYKQEIMKNKIKCCVAVDAIVLFLFIFMDKICLVPIEAWQNRKLVIKLSKNDFKTKFAGSYLGVIWAFIQPIVTVLVYWFVFEKGLKAGGINTKAGISVPFVLWLIAGLVPWFFFSDALNGATNALIDYSYLVKKVVFNISVLPIVKVISALYVHCFFIGFTILLYSGYHYFPDVYTLQIFYYSFCMLILTLGLSYINSAIVVFFRDWIQIINIVLQIGVWMTPIMWNIDTMDVSPILIKIFKLNPMYYIVAGYRDSLINKIGFWEQPSLTIYFWGITAVIFVLGTVVFRRLKIHFADVL